MVQSLSSFSAFYLVKIQPRNLPFPYIEHTSTLGSFSLLLTYVEKETVIIYFHSWKTQFGLILSVSEFIAVFSHSKPFHCLSVFAVWDHAAQELEGLDML